MTSLLVSHEGHQRSTAVTLECQRMQGRIVRVVDICLIVCCICGLVAFCHVVVCRMKGPDALYSTSLTSPNFQHPCILMPTPCQTLGMS